MREYEKLIIEHFEKNPNTLSEPLLKIGDNMGGGVRGQIAGTIVGLIDSEILTVTGGAKYNPSLCVNKTKIVEVEVNKKWEES